MKAAMLLVLFAMLFEPAHADEENKLASRIASAANESIGKQMWKGYGLANGYLGCAAAVSNVLKKAAVNDVHSAAVVMIRNQLLKGSHTSSEFVIKNGSADQIDDQLLIKTSRPGDILLAFRDPPSRPNTGGNAHCGIMGDAPNVYTNDWNDGVWKKVNIHLMFDSYRYVRLIRLHPAVSVENKRR